MKNDLEKLRKEIDEIDLKIVELLAKRLSVVSSIGKLKKQLNLKPLDEKRWNEVLNTKISLAKNFNLSQQFIKRIYNLIHEHALKIENEVK